MQRVSFNLKTGMRNEEVVKELRGKVSGESRTEVQAILENRVASDVSVPALEVVDADPVRETAVIRHYVVHHDSYGSLAIEPRYSLAGVNDEGLYYLHPIQALPEVPTPFHNILKPRLEDVLAWMNRGNEGFCRRLQGDVLIQFAELNKDTYVTSSVIRNSVRIGQSAYTFEERGTPAKSIMLGNHKLLAEKIIPLGEYVLAMGSELVLEHPEHGQVREKIPEGFGAVLAPQRGRQVSISGSQVRGYD